MEKLLELIKKLTAWVEELIATCKAFAEGFSKHFAFED